MSTATISIQYPVTQVSVKIANYTGGLVRPNYYRLFNADGTADVIISDQYFIYDLASATQDRQIVLPEPSPALSGFTFIVINRNAYDNQYSYWFSIPVNYPAAGIPGMEFVPNEMPYTITCNGSMWVIATGY